METLKTQILGGVATVYFNRPECLNSFNQKMHEELYELLKAWHDNTEIRVVVMTGQGRAFSAGQDLTERQQLETIPLPLEGSLQRYYNPLVQMIRQYPKPVIAAVNGVAAGAGANIALACDLVIAKHSVRFIQAFCHIGLIPDAGGTWMLPRLVGYAKAMGLALLGEAVHAIEAEQMGMIWKAIPDEEFDAYVNVLSHKMAKQPTSALALIKQAMYRSSEHDFNQQLELERNLQYFAMHSADFKEGVQAFKEKRPAQFIGR